MTDKMYKSLLFRGKFYKRILLMIVVFFISFYVSSILFGDLKVPLVMHLTELSRCPACYGVSVCPELYSNQILLDNNHRWAKLFNAKNIYYGYTKSNRRVVIKKLGHAAELAELDSKLCETWKLKPNCKPIELLNATNVDKKIIGLVQYYNKTLGDGPWTGLVQCPYGKSVMDLIKPIVNNKFNHHPRNNELVNVWTMLMINPEPIILQAIPKSKGWPVPAFGGVCGRVEVVSHEGEMISSLENVAWYKKLLYARKILEAALDFTFKHDRFRFYLMDWTLDNIVVNSNDDVTFIDLEDVVVLDKQAIPGSDLPEWYQRYSRENDLGHEFSFSVENMCSHHLSDHNIWAACYILADSQYPFLYPIPEDIRTSRPELDKLLNECLYGDNRFQTVNKLKHVMNDLLMDERVVGFGAVR